MKKTICAMFLLPAVLAASVTIVENGKAAAGIVYSKANDDSKSIRIFPSSSAQSAARLADYIKKSTGAQLTVGEKSSAKNIIQLEITPPGKMDTEAFTITFPEKNKVLLTSGSARGLEYACSEFLERYLGVRWLFPGPLGTKIPRLKTVKVPRKAISQQPSFIRRFLGSGTTKEKNAAIYYHWMVDNKGCFHEKYHCFHNLLNIIPVKKFGKSNPEFYPILNGKRFVPQPTEGIWWQPCMTSPGIVDAALKQIPANEKHCSLAVNDGGNHCECERCLAIDKGRNYLGRPHRSKTYLDFCAAVARKRPNTLFGVSAYGDVAEPPENIAKLPKNIVPEITYDTIQRINPDRAKFTANLLARWNKITSGHIGWYEYAYGQNYDLPRVYTRHLAKQLKWMYENNVRYLSGEYYPKGDWHDSIKIYVWLKLAWNINQDPEDLINEWCEAAVGKEAAPYIKAYFDRLEKFWTSKEVQETGWFKAAWTYLNWGNSSYLDAMPIEMIEECEKLLRKTVELADDKPRAKYFLDGFLKKKPIFVAWKKNQKLREDGKKLIFDRLLFDGNVDKSAAGFSKWQESSKRGKMYWQAKGGVNDSGVLVQDLEGARKLSLCWLKGMSAVPGKIYKVTVQVKTSEIAVGAPVTATVSYQKNNRWMPGSYSSSDKFIVTEIQNEWKTFVLYSRAPEETGCNMILILSGSKSNTGKIFWDNIKIETANYSEAELDAWQKVKFDKPVVNYNFNLPRGMWMKSGKNISRDEKGGRNNTPALAVGNNSSAYNIFALPGKGKRKVKVSGFYKGDGLQLTVKWQSAKPAWLSEKYTASAVFAPSKEWKEFVLYTDSPEIEKVRIVPFIKPVKNNGKIVFDDFSVQLEKVDKYAGWDKLNFGKAVVNYHFNTPRTIWIKSGKNISRDEKGGRNNTPALAVGAKSSAFNIFALPGKGKRKVKVSGFYKGDALKVTTKWQSSKPAWLSEKLTESEEFAPAKEWKEFVLYTWSPELENASIVPFVGPAKADGKIIFDDFTVQLEETK